MKKTMTDKALKDMILGICKEHDVVFAEKMEEDLNKLQSEWEKKSNSEQEKAVTKAYEKGLARGATRKDGSKRKDGDLLSEAMRYAFKSVYDQGRVSLSYMEEISKDDNPALSSVIKSFRTKSQQAGVAVDGGNMVPEDLSDDFINFLRPESVLTQMGTRRVTIPHGKKLWNYADSGTSVGWNGELEAATASKLEVERRELELKKMMVLNVHSREVLDYSREDFRSIVMEDMRDAARADLEDKFINGDGTSETPLGILAQKDAGQEKTSSASGSDIQEILRELISLAYLVQKENVRVNQGGYLMTPRDHNFLLSAQDSGIFLLSQIAQGSLFGFNVGVTNQLPEDLEVNSEAEGSRIVFGDFSQVIEGYGPGMEMRESTEAMVKNSGGQDVNLFTQDARAILMLQEVGILLRRPKAFATLEDCTFSTDLKPE